MATARIELPEKLIPVFSGPADVRYAHGGRGSGKTRSFATMAAVRGYKHGMEGDSGIILCARQYMNSLEDSSLEEVKRAIEDQPFLADYYEMGDKFIRSRDGRISFSFAGLDRNIASIKSKGRLLLCWVDEAEPVTDEAWSTLVPTLREEWNGWNAELWVTWNPKRKTAPVERRFRQSDDPLVKGVELNWRDNPLFPAKLERDRQRDMRERPEEYGHIWEGEYVQVVSGAYFAKGLLQAQQENRICKLQPDPLMTIRAYFDIGGTGARADACAIWIAQVIGKEARLLNYYESVGQPLATHVQWLRSNGYEECMCVLPHDGKAHDKVFNVSYESALRDAGFDVKVIPNMGAGAANKRIEAVRRMLSNAWFDDERTLAGREALGWYHEKRDELRGF